MFCARQRRLAWVFMLVLALELALLCCASIHLTDHVCNDHRNCAICAFVRTGLRRVVVAAIVAFALLVVSALRTGVSLSPGSLIADSPVIRRVRLND